MNIKTAKKEQIKPFQNSRIRVEYGEKLLHSGEIDLRLSRSQMARGISSPAGRGTAVSNAGQARNAVNSMGASNGANGMPVQKDVPLAAKARAAKSPYGEGAKESIKRGQKLPVPDEVLNGMLVGLRTVQKTAGVEIDASIFMVDDRGKTGEDEFIFYNNPISPCKSVRVSAMAHQDYYSHTVDISPRGIPGRIEKLAVTLTSDGGSFSGTEQAQVDIIDKNSKNVIMSFDFSKGLSSQTGIVVLEMYRRNGQWRISFIGNGFEGGLEALCREYGIDVED